MSVDLWTGALIDGAIWHGRTGAVTRNFRDRATYVALPLDAFEAGALPVRPDAGWPWQVRRRDHGPRDGTSLRGFIDAQLAPHGLSGAEVTLVTTPRTLGYGFNPVTFWLARAEGALRAVLAEVSNTFGERHLYLVRHPDGAPIRPGDRLGGEKLFHVSPFLPRAGGYTFRFDAGPGRFGAWVDWAASDGSGDRLGTSLAGPARALSAESWRAAARHAPLQAQRVMATIHWHAARLALRGVRYRGKPAQLTPTASVASERTHDA